MSHEYEMSVKNQRCPAWMISEFLASVPLINGRVTDTGQSMTRCQKPLPHPPPSRTKRRVNLRGLARTGRTRNFCLDVCPVSLYYTRISSGAFESPLEKRNVRRIIIFERRDRYFHRLAYIQINKLVVFNI